MLQCTVPCRPEVWLWKDQIDKIRAATDPKTQRLTDLDLVPRCPNCGGTVFPKVRVDGSFIQEHLEPVRQNLVQWFEKARQGKGVVIEVGAGFNTPSVIRWPGEQIVQSTEDWKLIRINLSDEAVPELLYEKAVGFRGDASEIIELLLNPNRKTETL